MPFFLQIAMHTVLTRSLFLPLFSMTSYQILIMKLFMENLLCARKCESTRNTKVHKKPEIPLALMELIVLCFFIFLALNLYLSFDITLIC